MAPITSEICCPCLQDNEPVQDKVVCQNPAFELLFRGGIDAAFQRENQGAICGLAQDPY